MSPPDPICDRVATGFDIQKTRGRCTLVEHRGGRPIAKPKPFPEADRFNLFYRSVARDRRKTAGPSGPMKLDLDEAAARHDPMVRIKPKGFLDSPSG